MLTRRQRVVMMATNHAVTTISQAAAAPETIISVKLKSQDIQLVVMALPHQVASRINIQIVLSRLQTIDQAVEAAEMKIAMANLRECMNLSQKLAMSVEQHHKLVQMHGHQRHPFQA
jgi:carbamoylphosphate synthase large subunit